MFSSNFFLGTSTAAAQVETAGAHPWRGLRALDGHVFERTTDHEQRRAEDAEYIARLGTVYRCGVDWSRLQAAPGRLLIRRWYGNTAIFSPICSAGACD